jgi:aryl-alcohol dehydrogenase-like predicted oxidoreductase
VISSKAGWDMWPGPYGVGGSRKYLLASLDGSLRRMGLEYVDIFYSHQPARITAEVITRTGYHDVPVRRTQKSARLRAQGSNSS